MFKLTKYLIIEKLDKLFLSFIISFTLFLFILIISYIFTTQFYIDTLGYAGFDFSAILGLFTLFVLYFGVPILLFITFISFGLSVISSQNNLYISLNVSKVKIYFAHLLSYLFSVFVIIGNLICFVLLGFLLNGSIAGQQLILVLFSQFVELYNIFSFALQNVPLVHIIFLIILIVCTFYSNILFLLLFFQLATSTAITPVLKVVGLIGNIVLRFVVTILIFGRLVLTVYSSDFYDAGKFTSSFYSTIYVTLVITIIAIAIRLFISLYLFIKEQR